MIQIVSILNDGACSYRREFLLAIDTY